MMKLLAFAPPPLPTPWRPAPFGRTAAARRAMRPKGVSLHASEPAAQPVLEVDRLTALRLATDR